MNGQGSGTPSGAQNQAQEDSKFGPGQTIQAEFRRNPERLLQWEGKSVSVLRQAVETVILVLLAAGATRSFGQESGSAIVRASISDNFGRAVQGARITLTSIGPQVRFTKTGGEAQFDRVPYGLYEVVITCPGFISRKEMLRVYQSSLSLKMGLELGAPHGYDPAVLLGTVRLTAGAFTNLWVRFVCIYNSDFTENAVDDSGRFEIDRLAPGKYLLLLFRQQSVIAMKPIDILGGRQVIEVVPELIPTR